METFGEVHQGRGFGGRRGRGRGRGGSGSGYRGSGGRSVRFCLEPPTLVSCCHRVVAAQSCMGVTQVGDGNGAS